MGADRQKITVTIDELEGQHFNTQNSALRDLSAENSISYAIAGIH